MPPIIQTEKCTSCGKCALICCMDVFGPTEPHTIPEVRYPEECWHCRACVMDCPSGAIEMRYPLPYTLLWKDAPIKEDA